MRREASRTLFTLSRHYQRDVADLDYEVIVLDHGSRRPLDPATVAGFGEEFRYQRVDTDAVSPCRALNQGVRMARHPFVMLAIDGARLLSPGLLALAARGLALAPRPFVFTLGLHLGPDVQNALVARGFSRADEDALLEAADWRADGYRLFGISTPAVSSGQGFDSELSESNLFALRKVDFEALGGFDERFVSPGGGLANLDLFERAITTPELTPVMLLGEATFHQQHGGVASEAPPERHPWPAFQAEYEAIRGRPYRARWRPPIYLGPHREECRHLHAAGGPSAGRLAAPPARGEKARLEP
jgi:hypothetical protein